MVVIQLWPFARLIFGYSKTLSVTETDQHNMLASMPLVASSRYKGIAPTVDGLRRASLMGRPLQLAMQNLSSLVKDISVVCGMPL